MLAAAVAMLTVAGCSDDEFELRDDYPSRSGSTARADDGTGRRAMILYAAGFNSLSDVLAENLEDLTTGYLPGHNFYDNAIFIVSRNSYANGYSVNEPTYVMRLYKGSDSEAVLDTLTAYTQVAATDSEPSSLAASAQTMRTALSFIADYYPADGYGLVFSSHGTGWLPKGYYASPSSYTLTAGLRESQAFDGDGKAAAANHGTTQAASQAIDFEALPGPRTKSIGQDCTSYGIDSYDYTDSQRRRCVELSIDEFAAAIPMHLEYIIFDACFMGGVEVAYALRDVADKVAFSVAEVIDKGFNYAEMAQKLIGGGTPDVEGVCNDFFEKYDAMTGDWRSATVSIAISSGMESLAETCRELVEAHRSEIAALSGDGIQCYNRDLYNRHIYHWFYDLEDIFLHVGLTDGEIAALSGALSGAVVTSYNGKNWHTDSFIPSNYGFDIDHYSGLSMYLPSNGTAYLDNAYKATQWNEAIGLL